MALKTIMEETTFEASIYSEDLGCYCFFIDPMPFGFNIGSTYRVEWGDDIYECVGLDGSALIPDAVFIGNAAAFGLGGNGEPFCIGAPFDGALAFLCLTDTAPATHTVAIYQEESGTGEDTSTGIIVKDRDGNDVIHKGAYGIRARTMDGGTKVFVDADTLAKPVETSVELDFSSGDMEVLPSEGEVFSEVNIPKPVNLIPENIAEGVDIAGIIGAFAGGGGSGNVAWGTFDYVDGNQTIEHGLGKVPDVVLIEPIDTYNGSTNTLRAFCCFSTSFASAIKTSYPTRYSQGNGSGYIYRYTYNRKMDASTSGYVFNANTETFSVQKMDYVHKYVWFAIAGLT
jgi:hypothetical protein